MFHFPDTSFDAAIKGIIAGKDIMYGTEPSHYHIQVPGELDAGTVFENADAEHGFYALVEIARRQVRELRLEPTARNVFAVFAHNVLQEHDYNIEVSRWLAIANALIVGVDRYETLNGHRPVNMAMFVLNYMEYGDVAVSTHH